MSLGGGRGGKNKWNYTSIAPVRLHALLFFAVTPNFVITFIIKYFIFYKGDELCLFNKHSSATHVRERLLCSLELQFACCSPYPVLE
jgi:hypothetical protein